MIGPSSVCPDSTKSRTPRTPWRRTASARSPTEWCRWKGTRCTLTFQSRSAKRHRGLSRDRRKVGWDRDGRTKGSHKHIKARNPFFNTLTCEPLDNFSLGDGGKVWRMVSSGSFMDWNGGHGLTVPKKWPKSLKWVMARPRSGSKSFETSTTKDVMVSRLMWTSARWGSHSSRSSRGATFHLFTKI